MLTNCLPKASGCELTQRPAVDSRHTELPQGTEHSLAELGTAVASSVDCSIVDNTADSTEKKDEK